MLALLPLGLLLALLSTLDLFTLLDFSDSIRRSFRGTSTERSFLATSIELVVRANEDKPICVVCVCLYRVLRVHPLPRESPSAITLTRVNS